MMNRSRKLAIALGTAGVVAIGGIAAVPALADNDDPGYSEQEAPGGYGRMADREGFGDQLRDRDRDCTDCAGDQLREQDREHLRSHMMDRNRDGAPKGERHGMGPGDGSGDCPYDDDGEGETE